MQENLKWNWHEKDVLLFANVFEKLLGTCFNFYKLDSGNYFSSPGLSWDAILKMTGVKLEKILDIDMNLFVEKGLRGWISYIAKRYSEVNNKYLKVSDPTKPSKFISYNDMNPLHCWAMSGYLNYGKFKWLKIVDNFYLNSVIEKRSIGYILEVDLKYPDKLHVLHNDYPLPQKNL